MSIETLLEAAKFLELQQQKAREENELQERRRQEQEVEKRRVDGNSYTQAVSCTPTVLPTLPTTATSPSTAPCFTPPRKDVDSLPNQQHQNPLISSQVETKPTSLSQSNGTRPPQQLQTNPNFINTASQHALQPALPAAGSSPTDDLPHLDEKKRPGGAGTKEVHNKLEKNRRAHLRECFETLKKNTPNVDEKKTSNLSVLRSGLRYIQSLKRKEKDYEHEMERLVREKIALQQRLAELKNELTHRLDGMEIDRVLRQTVQPDDDQASTSTASEGEDNIDEDMEDESFSAPLNAVPKMPVAFQPDLKTSWPASALITQHVSIPHKPYKTLPPVPPVTAATPITAPALSPTPAQAPSGPASVPPTEQPQVVVASQTTTPAHTHIVTTASLQPTVITHAGSASHASVIQTISHVIQPGPKHVARIAPSSSGSVQLGPVPQSISHITVHPVTHLPAIYPQHMAITQPAIMSRIAHTFSQCQMNGPSGTPAAVVGKQAAVATQVVTHHPQLLGQTVLNPVTMVTMPSFPVSTLKLA